MWDEVFDALHEPVIVFDATGRPVRTNRAAFATLGFPVTSTDPDAIDSLIRQANLRHLDGRPIADDGRPSRRALRGESVTREQCLATHADGREIVFEVTARSLCRDGRVAGAVTSWHDVTDRHRVEEALREGEARYRTLFENMLEGFGVGEAILDGQGRARDFRFTEINDAFEQQSGLTRDILGRPMSEVLPQLEPHWADTYCGVAMTGIPRRFENYNIDTDRHYDVYCYSPSTGRFAILFRDVTAERATQREVRERAAELQAVLEAVPAAVFVGRGPLGENMTSNRFGREVLRVPPDANVSLSAPAPERPTAFTVTRGGAEMALDDLPMQRALATGEDVNDDEFDVTYADGTFRTLLGNATPLRDDQGRVRGVVGAFLDITERKRAKEALRESERQAEERERAMREAAALLSTQRQPEKVLWALSRLLVQSFADWCVVDVRDERGEMRRTAGLHKNPLMQPWVDRACAFPAHGHTASGEVVRTGRAVLIPQVSERASDGRAMVDDEGSYRAVLRHLRPRSAVSVPIMTEGGLQGVFTCVRSDDPTPFAESDLRTLDLIAQRAALALENARLYNEAQEANRLKDEFLATLSHELRTPLNAILGWAHMLATGNLDAATTRKAAQAVYRNARVQGQLVADVLDVSRIITGKLRLNVSRVQVSAVLERAVESVHAAAEAKGQRLNVIIGSGEAWLAGDSDRLQQVFWNLLSNAVKFTPAGGEIEVRVDAEPHQVVVSVCDSGIGIAPEFLPHAFERFVQADSSTTRQHGGLGLGLAIVRHLVELHGGSVSAESAGRGSGATFRVSLPVRAAATMLAEDGPPADDGADPPGEALSDLCGVRVLLVDDEQDGREMAAALLCHRGAHVVAVGGATEALEALETGRPDVIVADIGMAGMDGYEFLARVRALPPDRGGATPAVALTGYGRPADRVRALRAGFQQHVAKPVSPEELVAVVAALVSPHREQD